MKTIPILALGMIAGSFALAMPASAQAVQTGFDTAVDSANLRGADPVAITDRLGQGGHYPDRPDGVPPELHRKVVHLYKRLHNAHPDASRKRIFLKIAEELGIAPRRLWNVYHNPPGADVRPPIIDVQRVDRASDVRPVDARRRDRAVDRQVRRDRVTDRPRTRVRRDRPVRTRPQRGG